MWHYYISFLLTYILTLLGYLWLIPGFPSLVSLHHSGACVAVHVAEVMNSGPIEAGDREKPLCQTSER